MRDVNIKIVSFPVNYEELLKRTKTEMIVIHHTGNPTDDDLGVKEINQSHQAQGWTCIGYHYVIRKDGTIEVGRPHWTVGAHAYGFNSNSIGIHVSGNFEKGKPTPYQIESLALLLAKLCQDYGLPIDEKHIMAHRDLMPTDCPGTNLYKIIDTIRGKAVWYQLN